MAVIKGTNVASPVVPFDTTDVHHTHEALYGKGGYRTVATTVDRDAIPSARREAGMLVYVVATGLRYELGSDLSTWTTYAGAVGPTGPAGDSGATGPTGPAGTTTWAGITDKPSTFAPSTHASSHASGGSDPITVAASQITSGTLATARLPASVLQTTNGDILLSYPAEEDPGYHYAISISYNGQDNRFTVTPTGDVYCASISAGIVNVQALYASGTISGNISAASLTSGTVATNRLGSGTASASTYLRGDQTWAEISTYTLPAASAFSLGGVIVGTGLLAVFGTVSVIYGTTAGTACQGNDSRLSDARTPTSHTHAASDIASGTLSASRLPVVIEQTQAIGNTGATKTLSLSSGSVQTATLSASCTFTMPTATAGASITLILTQGSNYTATFTGVKWPNGAAPTITATANAIDVLVFVSDGTNWYGAAQQKFS